MQEETKCIHLGDGVYAEFDGYHLVLRVNDHRSEPVVFLEPPVMDALIRYYQKALESLREREQMSFNRG